MTMSRKIALAWVGLAAFGAITASADVPVLDRTNLGEHRATGKHWLDDVEIRKGQSRSTKGVKCSWAVSPENALSQRADVAAKVASTCKALGVDPALALSIAYQESRFNQNCRAPTTPHSGGQHAEGVMQVLPSTGRRMFTQAGLGTYVGTNEDHNIKAGCLYLAEGKKITHNSAYHIAGGYHAGYESTVWSQNLGIPAGWPKTLDYAQSVTKKWYPIFSHGISGYAGGGKYAGDMLAANGLASGAAGIDSLQDDQATLGQRIKDQKDNFGKFDTERLEWVQNSRSRLLNAQATNSLVEALALLAQFKMLALSFDALDESEGSHLTDPTPHLPPRTGQDVTLVWDEEFQRWKILMPDGSWRYVEVSDEELVQLHASGSTPIEGPATTDQSQAAAHIHDLLNN